MRTAAARATWHATLTGSVPAVMSSITKMGTADLSSPSPSYLSHVARLHVCTWHVARGT
jgi:hypothetical protein